MSTKTETSDHAFSLYRHDVRQLVDHLTGFAGGPVASASFDVDKDGNVTVYVAGKEPLKL